ncbi:MAG: hypothetical protein Q9227_008388 [Pyrenula ochraceoflavens]
MLFSKLTDYLSLLLPLTLKPASYLLTDSPSPPEDFNWSSISPSSSLEYHPCYEEGTYQCARLLLPRDYLDPNPSSPRFPPIALAIIKLPATVSVLDKSHGGTILFNPGGPGGSGVDFLRQNAHRLRDVLDDPQTKNSELLSFDPRGMHRSLPRSTCFRDDFDRQVFDVKMKASGNLDTGPEAVKTFWAAAEGVGKLCEAAVGNDESHIAHFMSTPSVATDMLRIVEAIEDHRHSERQALHAELKKRTTSSSEGPLPYPPILPAKNQEPKLQYWGFSYGTILGNFFATLYPHRISRMLLDGVADVDDFARAGWLTNLQDTEKTVESFYEYCFLGKGNCPLYATADISSHDIRRRVEMLLNKLKHEGPVPVVNATDQSMGLVTYGDLSYLIFQTMYDPFGNSSLSPGYDRLAKVISDMLLGKFESMMPFLDKVEGRGCGWIPDAHPSKMEASPSVYCTDGEDVRGEGFADFKRKLKELEEQSPTVGPNWAKIPALCPHWPFRALWRHPGPFTSNHTSFPPSLFPTSPNTTHTSHPILFLGNTADPVTPLRNAYAMSRQHPYSRVLVQDSPGHCSIAAKSSCTREVVRRYFVEGVLPEEGVECGVDCRVWDGGEECRRFAGEGVRFV